MKNHKTNAARLLDRAHIPYRLESYPVDADDLSAAHLANALGIPLERVFKTLVLRGDRTGILVCIVPGGEEVDVKKAAKASGNKSCAMIPLKDLTGVTGYVRGGCSPLAMKRKFPSYLHRTALDYPDIHVSAGERGLQLVLSGADLARAAEATLADLTKDG